jgi:predicted metal-binding protein
MKIQIGKFYNICFEATNEEEVTFEVWHDVELVGLVKNGEEIWEM